MSVKSKGKKRWANILLLLLSLFVALLLAEILVRVAAPQQLAQIRSDIWGPDSLLSFKKKPLVNEIVNVGEGKVHMVTDESGYRINQPENRPTECPQSILFLGDSFLEALQVENEDTYPERLRAMVKAKGKADFCAINTGVGRYNPNNYYLVAKQELKQKKYDLVVVGFYIGNDFITKLDTMLAPLQPIKKQMYRWPRSFKAAEISDALWVPTKNRLSRISHLFVLISSTQDNYYHKTLTAKRIKRFFSNEKAPEFKETALACKHLKNLTDSYGIPLMFVLLPAPYQIQHEIFGEYLASNHIAPSEVDILLPNRVFTRIMQEEEMFVVDVFPYLKERHASSIQLYGKVDKHFSKEGHEATAEYVFPYVDSILLKAREMK